LAVVASGLSICLYKQGKFREAEEWCQQVVEAARGSLGDTDPYTGGCLFGLGYTLYEQQKYTEAHQA
jgi:TolA-binding protein